MTTAYPRLPRAEQSFLDQLSQEAPLGSLSIEQERERMRAGQCASTSAYPVSVQRCETAGCPVFLIRPHAAISPAPILFFLHGGGWVLGDLQTHTQLVCELAIRTGCVVAFLDYPRAPEHPFPAAIGAAEDAITEMLDRASTLALDSTRFAFGGDSAGGNLSTALLLASIQHGRPLPALQFLLYPAVQPTSATSSYLEFATNPNLSRDAMQWFWKQYLQGERPAEEHDARLSPLHAATEMLAQFPRTLVLTCEYDVLRDEGELLAAALTEAGVETTAVRWLGALHGFLVTEALSSSASAQLCLETVAAFIRRGLLS